MLVVVFVGVDIMRDIDRSTPRRRLLFDDEDANKDADLLAILLPCRGIFVAA